MTRVVLIGDDIAALHAAFEALGVATVDAYRAIAVQMDSTRLAAEELGAALAKFGSLQIAAEPRSKPAFGSDRPYFKKKKGRS
jgi:hypothetical protein